MEARQLKTAGKGGNATFIRLRPLTAEEAATGSVKELKVGGVLAGRLKNTYEDDKYKKTNFVLSNEEGQDVIITTAGNLGAKMKEVSVGAYVEITYKGKSPMKSGPFKGTPAHNFVVQYEA